ncbi:hypothetical protein BST36_23280 [Mycolicibacterium moriokaense]|uniref:DUF7064 domain-containing protein n=1 Tax=Mycolicibacterium moriokaense TaxID=39691 RepID=A0AAD1H7X4_9MYCO|nr:hypothetical protein [Mycolicibacterium moriokaense]MCV7039199.1 hypothetical protein [Mycolicibacterium moriokaense]ORB18520.1 hypothetical protein BST36_23280 [Mycolicibacterium moriokaense]BBX00104.1 hypothetical protein MMOR_10400 [Mycolicibacterium moriokaense]
MTTETQDKPFWEHKNTGFLTAAPDCDLLHPTFKDANPSPTLTETHFFGFSVPEENIHGCTYMWHHPNLGVVSGGAWVWQGIKTHALKSELFAWTNYMSDDLLVKDLWEYEFENGYRVETIELLKRHRLRYVDESRQNSFDIELEALMEPMLVQTGMHFEQAMRARGELTLRGKTYEVDCTHVRDRSWGQARSERPAPTPPIDWMTGVFDENLMFGCTAYDHPDWDPAWKGLLDVPGGEPTKGGWVNRDGRLIPIVDSRKRVYEDPRTLAPTRAEMVLTDAEGRDYEIHGEVVATNRCAFWPSMDCWISLARWECEGKVCYGDLQHIQWHDYVRHFHP